MVSEMSAVCKSATRIIYSTSNFPCYSIQELSYISGFHGVGNLLVDANTDGLANLTQVVSGVNASLTSTLQFSPLDASVNNSVITCSGIVNSSRQSSSENISLAGTLSFKRDQ